MVWISEKSEGGPKITTKPPSYQEVYVCAETTSGATARAMAQAYAPTTVMVDSCVLYRGNIECTLQGNADDVWDITVSWGLKVPAITFDTSGGSAHVTISKAQAKYPAPGKNLSDNVGIGYNGQDCEGVDMVIPQFAWTETYEVPAANIDFTYAATIASCTGKVNASAFRGFARGEVLFVGASGGNQKDDVNAEIQFSFSASPNATALTIGNVTGVNKEGWQYAWIYYENDADANNRFKTPKGVYVEQIYDYTNFSVMGI